MCGRGMLVGVGSLLPPGGPRTLAGALTTEPSHHPQQNSRLCPAGIHPLSSPPPHLVSPDRDCCPLSCERLSHLNVLWQLPPWLVSLDIILSFLCVVANNKISSILGQIHSPLCLSTTWFLSPIDEHLGYFWFLLLPLAQRQTRACRYPFRVMAWFPLDIYPTPLWVAFPLAVCTALSFLQILSNICFL